MISGNPTIMYKLPGIPEDYFKYTFALNDKSVGALAKQIIEVCELNTSQRNEFALKAKEFVMQSKNNAFQIRKLYSFLNKL